MEATNEQIDRNDLLASTRAVFVRTFVDALETVINVSADNLFAKAERANTSQMQKHLLEARGVLHKKSFDLKAQMKKAMEKLLHRSFQTTYSNYRPTFSNSVLDGPISLIDTSAFEDELRFNSITDRFRNEAGEQLRDLNIRIALLFEQDNIRERENPFRPYLFSRAIAMAVENVDAPPELHVMLTDQLAEDFVGQVPTIYAAVNEHLAENGIAVQLKVKKGAGDPRRKPGYEDDEEIFEGPAPRRGASGHAGQPHAAGGMNPQATGAYTQSGAHVQPGGFTRSGAYPAAPGGHGQTRAHDAVPPNARQQQPEAQASAVERLFNSVRALAARPFRGGGRTPAGPLQGELEADTGFPQGGFEHSGFPQPLQEQGMTDGQPSGPRVAGGAHGGGYGHDASGTRYGGGQGAEPGGDAYQGANESGEAYPRGRGGTGHGSAGAGHGSGNGGEHAGGNGGDAHGGGGRGGGGYGASDGSGGSSERSGGAAAGSAPSMHGASGAPRTHDAYGSGHSGGSGHAEYAGGGAFGGQGSGEFGGSGHPAPGNGYTSDAADGAEMTGAPGEEAASGRSRPSWISGKKAVGDVLRRFFAGASTPDDFADDFEDGADGETAAPQRAAPGLLAGTVQRLIRHSTPETPDMYAESGEIRNLIMERRSGLNEMASSLKEQMTIDIVSMLFEFILRDTQVPAEVRAQLGRLQFLVLKIALRDESLLTTKAHPARMLVNRIGSISLGLKQVDPSGVAVTEEICRIVEAILADETENPNLFLKMLDDLDSFIARELLTQEKGVATAVEAVEHAENRTLRLAHTSAQVSESLQGLSINEHLREFLENDWSRAIEYAERNTPAIAAEYRALIPDLLWSVLPKISEEDRQQLLALLPPILKTIHGGMEPIGWPSANKQTLMDWLFDAHTLVLRGNSATPPPITFSAIHAHFKKFVDHPEAVQPSAPGHVAPQSRKGYLEEAMRELDARINLLDHFFDDDPEMQAQLREQEEAEKAAAESGAGVEGGEPAAKPFDLAERLRVGIAIEVNLGGKPSVGRLNWINQNASNMVLTLTDQAEPSMISARMFQRLLRNDRVRFLEDEPVFERAVESLLSAAEA